MMKEARLTQSKDSTPRLDDRERSGDTRIDSSILEQARNLQDALEALEKIQRCGVAWESSRAVRSTLYALGDLIRLEGERCAEKGGPSLREI